MSVIPLKVGDIFTVDNEDAPPFIKNNKWVIVGITDKGYKVEILSEK